MKSYPGKHIKASCCTSFARFIAFFSLRKYRPKLYFMLQDLYGSWIGGLITLIQIVIIVAISSSILSSCFSREQYTITQSIQDFSSTLYSSLTFHQLLTNPSYSNIQLPMIGYIASNQEIAQNSCYSNVTLYSFVRKSNLTSLPTFPLQISQNGAQMICIFSFTSNQQLLHLVDNQTQAFTADGTLNVMFQFNNATYQELWTALQVGGIYEQQGSKITTTQVPVLGERQSEASVGFSLIEYSYTDDIFGTFTGYFGDFLSMIRLQNRYSTQLLIQQQSINSFPDRNLEFVDQQIKQVSFYVTESLQQVKRQPSSIVDAISRLGGILSLLKLSVINTILNRKCFERSLTKQLSRRKKARAVQSVLKTTDTKDIINTSSINLVTEVIVKEQKTSSEGHNDYRQIFSFEGFLEMKEKVELLQEQVRILQRNIEHSMDQIADKVEFEEYIQNDSFNSEIKRQLQHQWLGEETPPKMQKSKDLERFEISADILKLKQLFDSTIKQK